MQIKKIIFIILFLWVLFLFLQMFPIFPLLSGIYSFVFLSIIPGLLLLLLINPQLLKINYSIVFLIAFSIFYLYLLGFVVNFIGPYFNLLHPLSFMPIITGISFSTLLLLSAIYFCYKDQTVLL